MRITNLSQLNKKYNTQYKNRNMSFDYIAPNGQYPNNLEIYQIWSYNTIIGYYCKNSHYAIFTNHKYSPTTSKQITMLCNENNLNRDFIDKTFANFTTYSDILELIDCLK